MHALHVARVKKFNLRMTTLIEISILFWLDNVNFEI